jgi:hypothetical protein
MTAAGVKVNPIEKFIFREVEPPNLPIPNKLTPLPGRSLSLKGARAVQRPRRALDRR